MLKEINKGIMNLNSFVAVHVLVVEKTCRNLCGGDLTKYFRYLFKGKKLEFIVKDFLRFDLFF